VFVLVAASGEIMAARIVELDDLGEVTAMQDVLAGYDAEI
jgi:hypothetical protein